MLFFNSQSYAIPTIASVLVHGIVVYFIAVGWQEKTEERKIALPRFVPAELVQLEKTAPKAAVKPKPKTIDLTAQQRERERLQEEAAAKRRAEEQARKQQAEKDRIAKEKQAQEEAARQRRERELQQQREQELLQQELTEALAEEDALLQSEEDEALANSYSEVIYSRVYRNWSRPPSARNGMTCELTVQLIPNGRVVNVTITKSSGNAAFDRSAEQAVLKAEQFPELREVPINVFEQYFRRLIITFSPQDLRL